MQKNLQQLMLRLLELAFLVVAFCLLIPPVPSDVGETYPLFSRLGYAAGLFACSLGLACWRGGEHWTVAVLKLLLFLGFGWVLHARFWI